MIKLTDADRAKYTIAGDLPRCWEERAYRALADGEVNYWVNVGVYKMAFRNISDAWLFYSAEANGRQVVSLYRAVDGGWGELIDRNA
ncbi:hypothetical protein [Streptomyces spectabilis]|uniref:Uncharacterized protein n=1 Tax=Streptomyces spectabilis TaxID=68270 RepID=A0A516RF74_STRST|nr:hypothetical protein [Streptomyces spectabilis]QDQ14298.1 hypothetical protein FH965_30090 [Streptomyces spectabilis]